MSREIWRSVPSRPGWVASDQGRVAMLPRRVPMPHGGYKNLEVRPTKGRFDAAKNRYRLSVNGKTVRVAPMVCEAFKGPRPTAKHECMHLDEDSTNDRADNLAWGTRSENMLAPKLRVQRLERFKSNHPSRKLTDEQVLELRASYGAVPLDKLAEQYGICPDYARELAKGRQRPGVTP